MKKLEDIPKKNIYEVPDGYFDQLPTVIQARMAKETGRTPLAVALRFSLKYALPVIVLVITGILWFRPAPSVQMQLSEIDASQVALYLDNSYAADIDQTDNHDNDWTEAELDELADDVYSNMEYSNETDITEDILDDIDL
ncbi:MAG TPA: hypothetical protein VK508_04435 [Cyclobacteriaceae bacterium]|nr:hypothetical protein [Cyclobacteriaceae bacterium]